MAWAMDSYLNTKDAELMLHLVTLKQHISEIHIDISTCKNEMSKVFLQTGLSEVEKQYNIIEHILKGNI